MTESTPVKTPEVGEEAEFATSAGEEILLGVDMIAEPGFVNGVPQAQGTAVAKPIQVPVTASVVEETRAGAAGAVSVVEETRAGATEEVEVVIEGAFSPWSPKPRVSVVPAANAAGAAPVVAAAPDVASAPDGVPHFVSPEDEDRIDVPAVPVLSDKAPNADVGADAVESVVEAGSAESVDSGDSISSASFVGSGGSIGSADTAGSTVATASNGSGGQPPALGDVPGATDAPEPEDEKPMSLLEHLGELRTRLTRAFVIVTLCFLGCYGFAKELFYYLSLPLLKVMTADSKFIYTGVAEGFFVELKVSFVASVFVASPYLFYQIWAFIAPGLYDEEKRYIIPLSMCSALFFLGGAAFCYLVVFPFAFVFFMSYSTENIVAMLSINEYLSFSLKMLIAFGCIFEMPLFAFFLSRMGLVTAEKMRKGRKFAVLGIFIVAAILTPPDVFSQLLMAVPMLILYEISIIVAGGARSSKKTPPTTSDAKQGETA